MKERFKFRVWNNRDWDDEYGQVYYDAEKTYDYLRGIPQVPASSFGELLEDDQWIVEQCTGLKDKNGKLIYEGDIIKATDCLEWVVVFHNGCFCGNLENKYEPLYDLLNFGFILIGNTHKKEIK